VRRAAPLLGGEAALLGGFAALLSIFLPSAAARARAKQKKRKIKPAGAFLPSKSPHRGGRCMSEGAELLRVGGQFLMAIREDLVAGTLIFVGTLVYVATSDSALPFVLLGTLLVLALMWLCEWASAARADSEVGVMDFYFTDPRGQRRLRSEFLSSHYYKEQLRSFDLAKCAWMWWAYLLYGFVFRDVPFLLPRWLDMTQSVVAIVLAMLSYSRTLMRASRYALFAMAFVQMLVLAVPHRDTVAHARGNLVFIGKVALFVLVYSATRALQMVSARTDNVFDTHSLCCIHNQALLVRSSYRYSVCQRVVQSFWVLLVNKTALLLVALPLQLLVYAVIGCVAFRGGGQKDASSSPVLPTTTSDTDATATAASTDYSEHPALARRAPPPPQRKRGPPPPPAEKAGPPPPPPPAERAGPPPPAERAGPARRPAMRGPPPPPPFMPRAPDPENLRRLAQHYANGNR